MIARFLVATAVAAFAAGSAAAADLPTRKPAPMLAPVAVYNWTGFTVGLQAGWMGAGDDKLGWISSIGAMPSYRNLGNIAVRGAFIGARLGYDWQAAGSPLVIGVAADVNFDSAKRSRSGLTAAGLAYTARSKVAWDGSLRLRAGYAFDRFLVYATGGVAIAQNKYNLASTAPLVSGVSASKTFFGATVGAGVAYAVTNNMTVGLEYRFTKFESKGLSSPIVGGGSVHTVRSPDFHRVAATLDWKF